MKIWIRVFLVVGSLLCVGATTYYYVNSDSCGPKVAASTDILGTDWQAQIRFMDCGYGIGGGLDIVVVNKRNSSSVEIGHGNDVLMVKLASNKQAELNITIPNRSDILIENPNIDNIKLIKNYIPKDDPEYRKKYLSWTENKLNEVNREWYCQNVLPKTPDPARTLLDKSIAYTYYIPHGSKTSYCHESGN